MTRPRISEAQANADALIRRAAPYSADHHATTTRMWDFQRRAPRNLREAVRFIRQAYADEVPRRMTEGYDSIGEDGTPRFHPSAEAYIFGGATSTDGGRPKACDCRRSDPTWADVYLDHESGCVSLVRDVITYYRTPFRATLAHMEASPSECMRRDAAVVRHITIGGQEPEVAAAMEGCPPGWTRRNAYAAVSGFLARLSDVRVSMPIHTEDAAA